MNNKSGFTLVELLATIIILGIIISIIGYVAINAINKSKEKSYKVTINEIEKDANNYLMENTNRLFFLTNNDKGYEYQCVMVENLVDYGYLNNNIVKSNVNKDDTVSLDDYIYIERNKDTKSIEKVLYTKTEPEYASICGKAVNALGDIVFTSNPGFNEWSKYKDITITYKLKNLNDQRTLGNYIFNHNYDGESVYNSENDKLENNIKTKVVRVTSNGEMTADIKLKDETIVNESIEINKIDIVGPTVVLGNYTGSKTIKQTVTIPVKVTDVGSGVDHSSFTKDDIEVMVGNNKITDYSLTKVNNTDYNITINNKIYNGKVVLNIGKDKIFDNVHNGNLNKSIDTNITFDNTYKITYNANGGSDAPGPTIYSYALNGTVNLSSSQPKKGGYAFLGWSKSNNATTSTYSAGGAYPRNVANDITLYAVWEVQSETWNYGFINNYKEFRVPYTGRYKLEVWGAKGGAGSRNGYLISGGNGGYASGIISLKNTDKIYVYVGGTGGDANGWSNDGGSGGYNGGGRGGDNSNPGDDWRYGGPGTNDAAGGGGGATDMRLNGHNYGNRVIVAGGGGGGTFGYYGGVGGDAQNHNSKFGTGSRGCNYEGGSGGGGGGYYGGRTNCWEDGQGFGGTSFATNSLTSKKFTAGENSGNGKARITWLG